MCAGYSTAWTSQVIPFDSKVPSIVEMLSYWAISAMGIDGGYVPPPVSDEPDLISFAMSFATVARRTIV
jgi:hypothetical protein